MLMVSHPPGTKITHSSNGVVVREASGVSHSIPHSAAPQALPLHLQPLLSHFKEVTTSWNYLHITFSLSYHPTVTSYVCFCMIVCQFVFRSTVTAGIWSKCWMTSPTRLSWVASPSSWGPGRPQPPSPLQSPPEAEDMPAMTRKIVPLHHFSLSGLHKTLWLR